MIEAASLSKEKSFGPQVQSSPMFGYHLLFNKLLLHFIFMNYVSKTFTKTLLYLFIQIFIVLSLVCLHFMVVTSPKEAYVGASPPGITRVNKEQSTK